MRRAGTTIRVTSRRGRCDRVDERSLWGRGARRWFTGRMELPQHWATASGESPHLGDHGGTLVVWGWSSTSDAEAEQVARTRLADALKRLASGGAVRGGEPYYPRTPLREPVLEEVLAPGGALLGLVSRNRMGCEVLSTDLLLIADVDAPELQDEVAPARSRVWPSSGSRERGRLRGWVRRVVLGRPDPTPTTPGSEDAAGLDPGSRTAPTRPSSGYEPYRTGADGVSVTGTGPGNPSVAECLACEPVWEFARRHPDVGVRVYRTAAGLRVLVTGAGAPPRSDRARELLTELGSDPLYVELCETHDSYRARLTPKPFRIGLASLSVTWPCSSGGEERRWLRWVDRYDEARGGHAVCRLLSASGPVPGEVEQRLVELHDERCLVGEHLPLA